MRRLCSMLLGFSLVLALAAVSGAASEQALKLRAGSALSEYTPPDTFLSGNFVADEVEPAFIFGKVTRLRQVAFLRDCLADRRGRTKAGHCLG